jgi:hypothetical protein
MPETGLISVRPDRSRQKGAGMNCAACAGSGICDACSGYGYFPDSPETDYSGTDCTVCDGSSECAECLGTGDNTTDADYSTEEGAHAGVLEMRQ